MQTMNGFTIIAEREREWQGERVILGARILAVSPTEYEYVTAVAAPAKEEPRSWSWGHYFARDIHAAVDDYLSR